MSNHLFNDAAVDLIEASDVASRWAVFTNYLNDLGLDQVNYGILDTSMADRLDAPVDFLSTMRPDWLEFYAEQRFDLNDPHVVFVRNNNLRPYYWGESALKRLEDEEQHKVVAHTCEAGLKSQLSVTMPDPFGSLKPLGGMTLGSSMCESQYHKAIAGHEGELVALANLFHSLSIGAVRKKQYGIGDLSERERDCLSYIAGGMRLDAIANKLGIAKVTVEMHLKNARSKMKSATLAEAVAKAILFNEIELL